MIPGSNLLNMASTILATTKVTYYKYQGRTKNSVNQYVPAYEIPLLDLAGHMQPVPRRLYREMNLDFQKNYWTFFVSKELLGLERNISGDKIEWQGQTYQCESSTPWFGVDGWLNILCVQVTSPPVPPG